MIIAEIVIASFALAQRKRVTNVMEQQWKNIGQETRNDIQDAFGCCGFNADTAAVDTACDGSLQFCSSKIIQTAKNQISIVASASSVVLLLQVVSSLIGCCLLRLITQSKNVIVGD